MNMKNGEIIKKVTNPKDQERLFQELSSKGGEGKRKANIEISKLLYLEHEKLLISGSWDSTIKIYDESDPEESQLLRIMAGGHCDTEISALVYSSHHALLASGSVNGIIAVWDFELGKLETLLLEHEGEITTL